jgi:TPR repeat protein
LTHARGVETEKDLDLAVEWADKSAAQNYPGAARKAAEYRSMRSR